MADQSQSQARALDSLLGPGCPFELVSEPFFGTTLPVFAHRSPHLAQVLADSAQYGDHPYIITADEELSYAAHLAEVAGFAHRLDSVHGIRPGDRVMIAGANSVEWIVAFWSIQAVGAVAVGGNAWWTSREWEHALTLTEPALILADHKRIEVLRQAHSPVPVLPLEQARAHPDRTASLPEVTLDETDPAIILFTSGTSGLAKAVTHVHLNVTMVIEFHRFSDAALAAFGNPTDPKNRRYLLALPLFHIASLHNLAIPRLATGSTIALHRGAFDVDQVCALIESARVTNWGAPPTMAHRMVEHGVAGYDLSSLTSFALATAPSSPSFQERLRTELPFATTLVDSYGMTETSTGAALASSPDLLAHPGTVGRANIGFQLEIRDALNEAVADGVEGEVCVRSAYTMVGYWNDPAATAAVIDEGHWLHTGDIGVMRDGMLWLTSRRSDLILRGGENVYPAEVEAVLAEYPGVTEVAVVGIQHADLGQEVMAVVVVSDLEHVTEDVLREHAAANLAYYKVPSLWELSTTPLPRNATGKVMRRGLPGQS